MKINKDMINDIRSIYPCNAITEFGIPTQLKPTVDRMQALKHVLVGHNYLTNEQFEVFEGMYKSGYLPKDKPDFIDEDLWKAISEKRAIKYLLSRKCSRVLTQEDITRLQYGNRGYSEIKGNLHKLSVDSICCKFPWIELKGRYNDDIEAIISSKEAVTVGAFEYKKTSGEMNEVSDYLQKHIGKRILFRIPIPGDTQYFYENNIEAWYNKYYLKNADVDEKMWQNYINIIYYNSDLMGSDITLLCNNIDFHSEAIQLGYRDLMADFSTYYQDRFLTAGYLKDESKFDLILGALLGKGFRKENNKEMQTRIVAALPSDTPITEFDCDLKSKLLEHNIVYVRDLGSYPIEYYKKMKLTDLELDYLRLKMKMNGYDFISNDEFTDSLDDKDPEEIDVYDLYVADIIPEPLYLALINNGYYKVSDLNYAAIDTISPITVSHIAILKTVIKKYNLHCVETTDELRQVIVNSDGHDVDILVLFKYLHLDAESQAAVRELWLKFTNNVRGKAEELTYISDLTLTVSEYDAIINDKEYAPIAGLILYTQKEIPELSVGVCYGKDLTAEDVPYAKECEAENSLVLVITGLKTPVNFKDIKEYIKTIVSEDMSENDKKIFISFVTEFLYCMPDIKFITDVANAETYSPTYATVISHFKHMEGTDFNKSLDSIGDLIFASKPARRLMIMLFLKYVFTAKDQKNGDPFSMIK